MKAILCILILCAVPANSSGQGFRDFNWGTPKLQIIRKEGKTVNDGKGTPIGYSKRSISLFEGTVFYSFNENDELRGGTYNLELYSYQISELLKIFDEKYGRSNYKHYPEHFIDYSPDAYPPYISTMGYYPLEVYVWNKVNNNIVLYFTKGRKEITIIYYSPAYWKSILKKRNSKKINGI